MSKPEASLPMYGQVQQGHPLQQQQQVPPQAYSPGQQPHHAQGQYPQHSPPVMVYARNDALIAQYQKEIADNQLGCSDVFWFLCCGPFALICCLPKYNKQQAAQTALAVELAKH
ncbi:hypothetical protein EDD11_003587 [Mortierella claussenii]|nr:hypothetical protein EDD11_003587 [Mortierella claussenii]